MAKALHKQEAVKRKCQPSDAAKRADGREQRQPGVIDAHADQRNQAQSKRGQSASPPSFTFGMVRKYDTTACVLLSMFGNATEQKRKTEPITPKSPEMRLQTRTFNDIMRMLF